MKRLLLLLVGIMLTSCTADPLDTKAENINNNINIVKDNDFTVKWDSNQEGSYVEFKKYVMKNCKVIDIKTEIHREREFNVTIGSGQRFDMQIKYTVPQKYPELYLAIYKGSELQYEQEVQTQGFMLISQVNYYGNIAE